MKKEISVMAHLPEGRENAISGKELVSLLGLSSTRQLQILIAKERAQGALILSSTVPPGGYYTSKDPAEVEAFVRMMESKAKKTFKVLRSARQYLAATKTECKNDKVEASDTLSQK